MNTRLVSAYLHKLCELAEHYSGKGGLRENPFKSTNIVDYLNTAVGIRVLQILLSGRSLPKVLLHLGRGRCKEGGQTMRYLTASLLQKWLCKGHCYVEYSAPLSQAGFIPCIHGFERFLMERKGTTDMKVDTESSKFHTMKLLQIKV